MDGALVALKDDFNKFIKAGQEGSDNINKDIQSNILTPDFSIGNMSYGGHDKKYKQKYLKYKQKYLSLKKDIF